jgi:uncharacterized protein (DUF1499 family)
MDMKPAAALRAAAGILAAGAVLLLLASGPGARFGAWHWSIGLGMLRWTVYLGSAAAILALAGLALRNVRRGHAGMLAVALVAGLVAAAVPLRFQQLARGAPPIHEVTTDPEDPPAFVAVLALRVTAPNPPEYGGEKIAAQQRAAYPDIQPVVLALPVKEAFARAHGVSQALGWEVVAVDADAGRIEASDTTPWFGFKDDVVVRVLPAGTTGSRIDVRSKSRVGRGDAGANAKRVRKFLAALRHP